MRNSFADFLVKISFLKIDNLSSNLFIVLISLKKLILSIKKLSSYKYSKKYSDLISFGQFSEIFIFDWEKCSFDSG